MEQKKKRRKFKTGPRPTEDEPWKIKECLNCNLEECTNCFSANERKKEHKKGYKKNEKILFFGEMLTIKQISEKTGISRNKLYSYKNTGGAKHIEKKARENGYDGRRK